MSNGSTCLSMLTIISLREFTFYFITSSQKIHGDRIQVDDCVFFALSLYILFYRNIPGSLQEKMALQLESPAINEVDHARNNVSIHFIPFIYPDAVRIVSRTSWFKWGSNILRMIFHNICIRRDTKHRWVFNEFHWKRNFDSVQQTLILPNDGGIAVMSIGLNIDRWF